MIDIIFYTILHYYGQFGFTLFNGVISFMDILNELDEELGHDFLNESRETPKFDQGEVIKKFEALKDIEDPEEFKKELENLKSISPEHRELCEFLQNADFDELNEHSDEIMKELKDFDYYQKFANDMFEKCSNDQISDTFASVLNEFLALPNQGIRKLASQTKIPRHKLKRYSNGYPPTPQEFARIIEVIDKTSEKDVIPSKERIQKSRQKKQRLLEKFEKRKNRNPWLYSNI